MQLDDLHAARRLHSWIAELLRETLAGLEQYRLDRLLELRAVIDSLRAEQRAGVAARCLDRAEPRHS